MVHRNSISKRIGLFLFVVCLLFAHVTRVFAQSASYTINPAYQEVVVEADDAEKSTVTTTISLTNSTTTAATFEVFAIDFPDTQFFGSFQNTDFSTATKRQESAAVSFDSDRFVVDKGETHTVKVRVENRTDLKPGGTYVSVVIRQVMQATSVQQPVIPALASQLLIRKKGGEVRNLSLRSVDGISGIIQTTIPSTVALTFINDGNVHLVPHGTVTVTDIFGRVVAQGLVNDGSLFVLPGRQRVLSTTLVQTKKAIPLFPVTLSVIGDAETAHYSYEQSFVIFPIWLQIAVVGIVLSSLVFVFHKRRTRTKKAKVTVHVEEL